MSDSAATVGRWRVEHYRGRFIVCNGLLEVFGTKWAASFADVDSAEEYADALNDWESAKPIPSEFGSETWL